jgi:hypothetical protein
MVRRGGGHDPRVHHALGLSNEVREARRRSARHVGAGAGLDGACAEEECGRGRDPQDHGRMMPEA